MTKKCMGCGIELQDEEPNKLGYARSLEMFYCERCFKMTHYHDLGGPSKQIRGEDILKLLEGKKGFVFFFIDFLNLNIESLHFFRQIAMPKCLVISKSDTIPKSLIKDRLKENLKKIFNIQQDIIFIKKNSQTSINKILTQMTEDFKNFYFVGMTNAGKSTFLNDLLKTNNLTVSEQPNTTLNFIKIKFSLKTIYDTPGIPYVYYESDLDFLKKANVTKEIKPISYPLKETMALLLEDRLRLEVTPLTNVIFFGSDKLKFLKVYQKNERLKDKASMTIQVKAKTNVTIKGVGILYFKQACCLTIYGVSEDVLVISPSFLRGDNYE